jgi:hypothetical protein
MTETRCTTPIDFVDVVDYWAGDLPRTTADRLEEHVFACAECAGQLAEGWHAASPLWSVKVASIPS